LRIGTRHDLLHDVIRTYTGIFIVRSSNLKCSLANATKSCYRSANATFGTIGRIAPEEASLELISPKCIQVLIYGLEACDKLLTQCFKLISFLYNIKKRFTTESRDETSAFSVEYMYGRTDYLSNLWFRSLRQTYQFKHCVISQITRLKLQKSFCDLMHGSSL